MAVLRECWSLQTGGITMPAAGAGRVLDDKLLFMDMPTDPPGDPRNPYADYAEARETHPVLVAPDRFGTGGPLTAFVYKHADVVEVFHDNETFSSRALHDF